MRGKLVRAFLVCLILCGIVFANLSNHKEASTKRGDVSQTASQQVAVYSATEETPRFTAVWRKFRERFPFHIQVLAMAHPDTTGERILIISEPPPHVTLEDLAKLQPQMITKLEIRKHPIGHDGWVKDVVATIRGSGADFEQVVRDLSTYLFGTDYKSYVIDLDDVPRPVAPKLDLDLTVTSSEINTWLLAEDERLIDISSGSVNSLPEVIQSSTSEVYFSSIPGIVLWWLPAQVGVAKIRVTARVFSLDSDLIIGALGMNSGLLVVGRERRTPLDVVHPLRAETLALLDAVQSDELGQSFQRNHPLAGRRAKGSDWAPIYLSPELVDTEYGSLLNITDQILKSWSNHGLTKYYNFPYPDPTRYPFAKDLPAVLGADEVTYNWNTRGAAYQVPVGDAIFASFDRTGALPVSYIPGEKGSGASDATIKAEDIAVKYFASLSDPMLVRVVQYAGMYQILHALHSSEASDALPSDETPANTLTTFTERTLRSVGNMDYTKRAMLLERATVLMKDKGFSEADIVNLRPLLEEGLDQLGELGNEEIHLLLNIPSESLPDNLIAVQSVARLMLPALASLEEMDRVYAETIQGKGWIHTPVVVVSSATGRMRSGEGGHNLYSELPRVRFDASVKLGEIKAIEEGGQEVLLLSPQDASIAARAVRTFERGWNDPALALEETRRMLATSERKPVRLPGVALGLNTSEGSSETLLGRGLDFGGETGGGLVRIGHWGTERLHLPVTDGTVHICGELKARVPNAHLLVKAPDQTITLLLTENGEALRLYTTEDAQNLIAAMTRRSAQKGPMVVEMAGWTPNEAEGFLRSVELRLGVKDAERDFVGVVHDGQPSRSALVDLPPFSNMKLSEARIIQREVKVGSLGSEMHLSFEIPFKVSGRPSVIFRIRAFFKGLLPESVLRAFQERVISRVLAAFGRSRGIPDLAPAIREEIRAIAKDTGIDPGRLELIFETSQGDVYIVRITSSEKQDDFTG